MVLATCHALQDIHVNVLLFILMSFEQCLIIIVVPVGDIHVLGPYLVIVTRGSRLAPSGTRTQV
jgi:hypothetical protein